MPSTRLPWEITLVVPFGSPSSCLLMEPHGVSSRPVSAELQGEEVASTSGAGFLDKDGARPAMRYQFEFATESREETAFLRDYFDAKAGRATPFWFPTWVKEVTVSNYFNPGDLFGHIWFVSEGYAEKVYPLGAAYRRLLYTYGNEWNAARISGVALNSPTPGIEEIVNTDGTVSTNWTSIVGAVGRPYTEARGFTTLALRFGRFDTDLLTLEPHGDGCGTVTLPIIEMPDEAVE